MSAITIENDLIHYEVLGRGRPVIFVHGWLGSWRYWMPTMQQLSTKFRTYALDLWGFGDSGKDATKYTVNDQVKLLSDFMEKLGIPKAAIVGHSFGAAVSLRFATLYPDRAPRLMLISAPLMESSGSPVTPASPVVANTPAPVNTIAQPTPAAAPVTPPSVQSTPQTAPTPSTTSTTAAPKPGNSTPAPQGATTTPAQNTTPMTTVPVEKPVPAAAPIPAQTQAATMPQSVGGSTPVTTLPASSSPSDTLPRNPLKGMGGSIEEILAKAQAENMAKMGTAPAQPAATPTPDNAQSATTGAGALLPNTIGKPVPPIAPAQPVVPAAQPTAQPTVQPTVSQPPAIPAPAATPAASTQAPAAPTATPPAARAATPGSSTLVSRLTGVKASILLTRTVDREIIDTYKLAAEVDKTDEIVILKTAQSFAALNLVADLQRLTVPALLLHGKEDQLLDAPSPELIALIDKSKAKGQFLPIVEDNLKHFPMLEITAKFNRLLMDFLEAPDLVNIQFKDQWKRQFR